MNTANMYATVRRMIRAIHESDQRLLDIITMYLVIKVGFVLVALLGSHLLPFNWRLYNTTLCLDIQALPDNLRAFNTWDTQHYILLSQRGYGVNPMSNAFYPLYPYLIRLLTPLFFNKPLIAAYVIANLLSLLVPVYMYKVSCLFGTKDQAFRATLLLLAFPTAFYLSVAYTESLYLSLCLMAFYYLFTGDVKKACFFVSCCHWPAPEPCSLLYPSAFSVSRLLSARIVLPVRTGCVPPEPFYCP